MRAEGKVQRMRLSNQTRLIAPQPLEFIIRLARSKEAYSRVGCLGRLGFMDSRGSAKERGFLQRLALRGIIVPTKCSYLGKNANYFSLPKFPLVRA